MSEPIMSDLSKNEKDVCLKLWHSLIKINKWHPSSILVCSMEPYINRACKTCFKQFVCSGVASEQCPLKIRPILQAFDLRWLIDHFKAQPLYIIQVHISWHQQSRFEKLVWVQNQSLSVSPKISQNLVQI
jgi:hypothetical protein